MSNALEALMGMTNDQVAAYTARPETEGHIVIDENRRITVPEPLKRIAVQHDHDVETVTFDCPRYWDNRDLSEMVFYISYKLTDGSLDSYIADNVVVDDDVIHFDWTISQNVTRLSGAITFLVCAKKTDAVGNIVNHWNSELCSDLSVSTGMECVDPVVVEQNSDLITQLLARMGIVEQINVQADEMRTLYDGTIAAASEAEVAKQMAVEAKTTVVESAEEIRNLYSNAIVGTASGEVVRVDDVSPIEHTIEVKARSKNLLNTYKDLETKTIDGITFVFNGDGTVTIDGTCDCSNSANAASTRGFIPGDGAVSIKKGTTVTLSGIYGIAPDGKYAVRIRLFTDTKTTNANGGLQGDYYQTTTITVTEDCVIQSGHIQILDGCTVDNMTIKPQLEIGDVATEFTPYVDVVDIEDVEVTTCGKNMFDSSKLLNATDWTEENGVYSGYAWPVHEKYNQLIDSPLVAGFKPNTQYVLTCKAYVEIQNGAEEQTGLVLQFKHSDGSLVSMYIKHSVETEYKIVSTLGKTVIGVYATYGSSIITHIRDIQVEEGAIPTDFEPYRGFTNLTSVSPTMTVMPNKPGVVLDIEYNKDINCVFDEINSLLELLLNGGA